VIGNLICADPVEVDISCSSEFGAVVSGIATEYRSALETRLPTLQRVPPYCAKPESWAVEAKNVIGASINFRYRKANRLNAIEPPAVEPSVWPPIVELNIFEEWAVQIAPIWITLAETDTDTKIDLQFNSALITDMEQRMFVSKLLESVEQFVL
jgi:hypothetical protein